MARTYAYTPRQDGDMAAYKGRYRRPDNKPTELLQARVSPEIRRAVHAAAQESGVSASYYVEAVLNDLLADGGALPVVSAPIPDQLELPIPAA